jgi:predicted phosphodiesterase
MTKQSTKIVWICDLHVPFHKTKEIMNIFYQHNGADYLVVGGDLLDCHSLSVFPKHKHVSLEHEYQLAYELITKAAGYFSKVILIGGNHEARFDRNVKMNAPIDSRFLLGKPLLQRIADREKLIEGTIITQNFPKNISTITTERGETQWYYQIGKTLFAHPEKYTKASGSVALATYEFFIRKNIRDLDCVVVGHVHRLNCLYHPDVLLIEGGSLCQEMSYTWHPKIRYPSQTNGYAVLYQKADGSIDKKKTRVIPL